jgi:hypothetical protein
MQDDALRAATASEPLTLDEEYEMQARCVRLLLAQQPPSRSGYDAEELAG